MAITAGQDILATDFVGSSSGASDSGKVAKLDSAGKIDESFEKAPTAKVMTAGGTINGATLPVPIYQNTTDNEIYACDADDTAKLNFIGFAVSNSTDGNSIDVILGGIVGGFSGLDEGEQYYVQDAVGTIGKTKGTYDILVGQAISATELLIIKGTWQLIKTEAISASSSTDQVSDTSTIPSDARFIVIRPATYSLESTTYANQFSGHILLLPNIIDTNYMVFDEGNIQSAAYYGIKASISGSTLTIETLRLGVGGGRSLYLSGTVYYFK